MWETCVLFIHYQAFEVFYYLPLDFELQRGVSSVGKAHNSNTFKWVGGIRELKEKGFGDLGAYGTLLHDHNFITVSSDVSCLFKTLSTLSQRWRGPVESSEIQKLNYSGKTRRRIHITKIWEIFNTDKSILSPIITSYVKSSRPFHVCIRKRRSTCRPPVSTQ